MNKYHKHTSLNEKTIRQIWECVYFYYVCDWPQSQIARRMGISRMMVSRHLVRAKKMGMVKIIFSPPSYYTELELRVAEKYGLRRVRVVPVETSGSEHVKRVIASATAQYSEELLDDWFSRKENIGKTLKILVAGGTQVLEVVECLTPGRYSGLQIYPTVAGPLPDTAISAGSVAGIMAAKYPKTAKAYDLVCFTPVNGEEKDKLLGIRQIKRVLDEAKKASFAIVGMGNLEETSTLGKTLRSMGFDIQNLRKQRIVGDISSTLLDEDGNVAELPFHDRILGIKAQELRCLHQDSDKRIIGVAGGIEKYEIIHAVLKGGGGGPYISDLCTDDKIAQMLLRE